MRGVIALLLIAGGIELAYLILAGKLPLSPASSGPASKNTAPGTGGGPDPRALIEYKLPSKQSQGAL